MLLNPIPTPGWFLLSCAAGSVILLLVLIARIRLHPALALTVAAFTLGLMIQSFFRLEVKGTLKTWTVLETVLSVAGLCCTLILSAIWR